MARARDQLQPRPASGAELVREREEHRVRPEQRAGGRAPPLDPRLQRLGVEQMVLRLLRAALRPAWRGRRSSRGSRGRGRRLARARAARSGAATRRRRSRRRRACRWTPPPGLTSGETSTAPKPRNGRTSRLPSSRVLGEARGRARRPSPAAMQASVAACTPSRSSHQSTHGSSRTRSSSAAVCSAARAQWLARPCRSQCSRIAQSQSPQPSFWRCGHVAGSRSPSSV